MPHYRVHEPERAGPHRRVRVTTDGDDNTPVVTFYGSTDEEARNLAKRHGYAVPDRLVYTVQRLTSLWQANVRYDSNPPSRHEAVFYAPTEAKVRERAERWMQQEQEQPSA